MASEPVVGPQAGQEQTHSSADAPRIAEILHAEFARRAAEAQVARLTIGLGYTAVETAQGDVGLSYTMVERSASCTRVRTYRDFEGQPVSRLLDLLRSDNSLERSLAVAAVNALNRPAALSCPDDATEGDFMGEFGVRRGTRVAMVGFFGPVLTRLRGLGAEVHVLDRDHGMGDEATFLVDLGRSPQVLILTATSILSDSFERFVGAAHEGVRIVVLGPTTPMVPSAYRAFPVDMLGGLAVVRTAEVVAAVRQGAGTRQLLPLCRKVSLTLERE